jgi:hypothetical protein
MPTYVMNEGAFELPGGWQDRTVTALSFPGGGQKSDATLTVTRDPSSRSSASLPAYVDKQLVDMAKSCPRFDLIGRKELSLAGAYAQSVEYTWRTPDGTQVHQLQVVTLMPAGDALVFTATAPDEIYDRYASTLRDAILSFRFR